MTKILEVDKTLSPLENDWLSALPAKYRRAAFLCYKDMKDTIKFNNVAERNKVTLAYMDAFVTAMAMAYDEGKENEEDNKEAQSETQDKDQDAIKEDANTSSMEASGHGTAGSTQDDGTSNYSDPH